jgi:CHASE2 domain-containing sensor protein
VASSKPVVLWTEIKQHYLKAWVVTIVLTGFFIWCLHAFEHTHRGHLTILWTYAKLHRRIAPQPSTRIVVVDTSDPPNETPRLGTPPGQEPTSRTELLKRLEELLAHKPAAIGIDIDFSPESRPGSDQPEPKSQDDPAFFATIHKLREESGVPIFLGVHSQLGNAVAPLGIQQDNELAATIPVAEENTIFMPLGLPTESKVEKELEVPKHCFQEGGRLFTATLAHRMAEGIPKEERPQTPGWLKPFHEEQSEATAEGIHYSAVLVNYTKLEDLQKHALTQGKKPLTHQDVQGKFVLLGDATRPSNPKDRFEIPGHGSLPGVFLHASALYSLLDDPVYELKFPVRISIDIFFAVLVATLTVALARRIERRSGQQGHHGHGNRRLSLHERLEILGFAIAAIVFLLLASALASRLHILYLDAVLAASGLLAHGIAGVISHRLLHRIFPGDHASTDIEGAYESNTEPEPGSESSTGTADHAHPEPETQGQSEG